LLRSQVVELQNTLSHKHVIEESLKEEAKRTEVKLKGRKEGLNVEYLRNVMIKYLTESEAIHKTWKMNSAVHVKEKRILLQVIATILEFTKEEKKLFNV